MTRWPDLDRPAQPGPPRPTLFLDRDGVVIVDRDYLADPDGVELVAGVPAALRRARAAGWQLIGVSNQSGLGRGIFGPDELEAVMRRLDERLRAKGCPLDAFFFCPHGPADDCACRKPRTGLLDEAEAVIAWDRARSWMVGDKVSDIEFAQRAGLRSILVRTGHGAAEESRLAPGAATAVVEDLPAAIDLVLGEAP